jgi:hypothetical protein
MREPGERFLSNTCCRNFIFENHKNPPMEVSHLFSKENQVHNYMHDRMYFHTYSDI